MNVGAVRIWRIRSKVVGFTDEESTMASTETIQVQGMTCEHCVRRVRDAVSHVEGVRVEEVDIGSVQVRTPLDDPARRRLEGAIRDAGYEPA